MSGKFTINAIQTGTASYLKGIINQSYSPAITDLLEATDGANTVKTCFIDTAVPMITFDTFNIKDALDFMSVIGAETASGQSAVFSFKKKLKTGALDLTNGIKLTAAGFFMPTRLRASAKGAAVLSCSFYALSSDGITAPVAVAAVAPSITVAAADLQRFKLGPVKIGSSMLVGSTGWEIDFGLDPQPHILDGAAYPTEVFVGSKIPKFSANLESVDILSTVGPAGLADDVALFLRRIQAHSTVYANDSTEHLKFYFTNAWIKQDTVSGQNTGDADDKITGIGEDDNINAPIIYSSGQAIE